MEFISFLHFRKRKSKGNCYHCNNYSENLYFYQYNNYCEQCKLLLFADSPISTYKDINKLKETYQQLSYRYKVKKELYLKDKFKKVARMYHIRQTENLIISYNNFPSISYLLTLNYIDKKVTKKQAYKIQRKALLLYKAKEPKLNILKDLLRDCIRKLDY